MRKRLISLIFIVAISFSTGALLACALIRLFWNTRFTDLDAFRAIDAEALASLGMTDKGFGWTVQMQVKAAQRGLVVAEIPVS